MGHVHEVAASGVAERTLSHDLDEIAVVQLVVKNPSCACAGLSGNIVTPANTAEKNSISVDVIAPTGL
jgi:hypothetical protein